MVDLWPLCCLFNVEQEILKGLGTSETVDHCCLALEPLLQENAVDKTRRI